MADANKETIRSIWAIKRAIPGRRNLLVVSCLFLAGVFDGIGIATLLPLIAVLGDTGSKANKLSQLVLHVLDRTGLPRAPVVLLGIIAGAMALKAALSLLALQQVGRAVADVGAQMRLRLIDALLKARWGFYVRQPVGRFTNALGDEASRAGDAYDAMMHMLSLLVQSAIYLTIAALASWPLAFLSLGVSLLMIGTLNRLLLLSKRTARIQSETLRAMLSRLTDVLAGIKPMKAMARQARFNVLFLQDLKLIKRASRRQVFASHTNRSLQEPILALCLSLGVFFALQVLHMQVGEVMVMSLLLAKIVSTIGKAQQELQNVYRHESGYWSVRDTIAEAEAEAETAAGTQVPEFKNRFTFENVSFAFSEHVIVRDASFQVGAGEVIALTGPSGAGKTTLVDLLLGLHTPQSGRILIDGISLADVDVRRWRALTGYVPQELTLFHDSILMNVTLGEAQYVRADAERALRDAGAWKFVSELPQGVDTVAGERGSLLSGGQRQRIALARALVHGPRLLVLDEATSALDPVTESLIVRNVGSLAREMGLTILAISHNPAWVQVADRVLRLEDGKLSEVRSRFPVLI